jgi:hypothetical protein
LGNTLKFISFTLKFSKNEFPHSRGNARGIHLVSLVVSPPFSDVRTKVPKFAWSSLGHYWLRVIFHVHP